TLLPSLVSVCLPWTDASFLSWTLFPSLVWFIGISVRCEYGQYTCYLPSNAFPFLRVGHFSLPSYLFDCLLTCMVSFWTAVVCAVFYCGSNSGCIHVHIFHGKQGLRRRRRHFP
ncbi:hypothetical protein EDD16DRAFT_1654042, partial [Pisolithus croceorrhizus]